MRCYVSVKECLRRLVQVLFIATTAYGCHAPRFFIKREIGFDSGQEKIRNSRELRSFFSDCLLEKASPFRESWQSIVDFSVLDTTWYDKFESQECRLSDGGDTVSCWREAIVAYLENGSALYNASMDCIKEFAELKNAPEITNDPTCRIGGWTSFFNRDDPKTSGDNELLDYVKGEFPGRICDQPTAIDARVTSSGVQYSETNQTVAVNPLSGLICVNARQKKGPCLDYMTRYCCPQDITSKCAKSDWTPYYNDHSPDDAGDFENFSILRHHHPEICQYPSEIQATLVDGTYYKLAQQSVNLSLSRGLSCKNSEQSNGQRCLDYQVRFCCPSVKTTRHIWYTYGKKKKKISKNLMRPSAEQMALNKYSDCAEKSFAKTTDVFKSSSRKPLDFLSIADFVDTHVIYCDSDVTNCSQGDVKSQPWHARLPNILKSESSILKTVKKCNKEIYTASKGRSRDVSVVGWSQWSSWGHCPARCGERGSRLRRRQCLSGAPGQFPCLGSLHDIKLCQPDYCPAAWGEWSRCQATCGMSRRVRTKSCQGEHNDDPLCRNPPKQSRKCFAGKCKVQGVKSSNGSRWTLWSQWSNCYASCGRTDFQRRRRQCRNYSPGSRFCRGKSFQVKVCKGSCGV